MSQSPPNALYVPSTSQLVLELFVRDLPTSLAFYNSLGFTLVAQRGSFAELSWESHLLFLDASHPSLNLPPQTYHPQANVRVMVPDVDAAWERAKELGARVLSPIEDRYYGLRDFTILDPDGFGVRFGTRLRSDVG
ncbi:Glyoxalase/Bleomycin resistance protein/Dihydroxybiphenyl dioxygenase [Dacryopinax primogenitus]|uniref:Glyoxalase/Bleomycin resistance protein/Dihydroxybiphenyl dioxygenase n=1 Tax=Dacryopinax primogenitus (strain DJM 731) TaxID=1858805 RepID=M5G3E1_DACPD|nr:Glyoxalase/Bleomycin resistance protein/Dihydroxybiphenyl dioxygenase [Dacryopinax primogenitus]EJU03189.1 Glyoxalase/Bleomycin resistance protein/Dihydroxybiphenyl dioxygenase [Dacryopinax primogenitus]